MSDAAYLEFDGTPLYFEAVTSEMSEHVSTVTEHAVEEGADVADHVRASNPKVTLEVFISNTPIADVNGWYGAKTESVELDVPKVEKKLIPTPGALLGAAASAIGDLLSGKEAFKAQVLKFPGLGGGGSVVLDTMVLLEQWREGAVRGKVILPWGTYDNMLITRVSPTRNAGAGGSATFTIEFQGVRLVESKLVTAPVPTETRGKVTKAKGRQPASFVRDPPRKKSLLASLLGSR